MFFILKKANLLKEKLGELCARSATEIVLVQKANLFQIFRVVDKN